MSRFNDARNKSIEEILQKLRVNSITKNNKTFYQCINPSHTDKHPSMTIKDNRFKCWGCGASGSSIDLVKMVLNLNDIEAVNWILSNKESIKPIKEKSIVEPIKTTTSNTKKMILKNSKKDSEVLKNYFFLRGLGDIYKYLDKDQLQILSNSYKGNDTIIYNFPKSNFIIQKGINKKTIYIHGHNTFTTYKGYNHNRYAIVEGIEDGLSALSLGYNFISLNSVSNVDKLLEAFKKHLDHIKDKTYYLALDNDKIGIEGNKKLKKFFEINNISYSKDLFKLYYNGNTKDLNDYIKNIKKEVNICN